MAADIREQASLSVQRQLRFLQGLSDRDLARFVAERKHVGISSFQEVKELLEKYGRATAEVIDADYTASNDGNFRNNLVSLGIVARDYWKAARAFDRAAEKWGGAYLLPAGNTVNQLAYAEIKVDKRRVSTAAREAEADGRAALTKAAAAEKELAVIRALFMGGKADE